MREGRNDLPAEIEAIGRGIVESALEVHRALGPGLLESTYEVCLSHMLQKRGHRVDRQLGLPIAFDDILLEAGYRIDMMVDDAVVIEVKAVEAILPVHEAQLLTYMRHSRRSLGYLINFNVPLIKHGIRRRIWSAANP